MSDSEVKPAAPTNQSFEEFRGWMRGFLENLSDDGMSPGGVKRLQDELDRVDPSMAAAPPVTITRHLDPLGTRPPYVVGNDFPWPGGVTTCNSVANAH